MKHKRQPLYSKQSAASNAARTVDATMPPHIQGLQAGKLQLRHAVLSALVQCQSLLSYVSQNRCNNHNALHCLVPHMLLAVQILKALHACFPDPRLCSNENVPLKH
jgi:hypothetical protein